ncbi:MAG: MFS transporter [Nanoarchaeota archaeon]|nr:MFS transporter [Nanoarchaeota archaeon]
MKTRKQKLRENIWKFYLFRVFSSIIFVAPIFVLFLQENGLNMTQIMLLTATYTVGTMFLVVPSGILADHIGRRKVLIFGNIIYMVSWAFYGMGSTFLQFFVAELVFALASALWFSAGSAFFYDTLLELREEKRFKKLYGNVSAINYLTWGASSIIGGYIALFGFRHVFFYTTIPILFSVIIAFSFTETRRFKHVEKNHLQHLKEAAIFAASHRKLRFLMVYSAILLGVWISGYVLYQPYLKSIAVPLAYFGAIYFLLNIAAAIGSKSAHGIDKLIGEKNVLLVVLSAFLLCYLGMSLSIGLLGMVFPVVIAFFFGVWEVSIVDYTNKHVKSHNRATIMSLGNCMGQMSSTIVAPFFGWITDQWDISTAFKFAFVMILINLVYSLVVLYFVKNKKN